MQLCIRDITPGISQSTFCAASRLPRCRFYWQPGSLAHCVALEFIASIANHVWGCDVRIGELKTCAGVMCGYGARSVSADRDRHVFDGPGVWG